MISLWIVSVVKQVTITKSISILKYCDVTYHVSWYNYEEHNVKSKI